jgi:hypothetical protein
MTLATKNVIRCSSDAIVLKNQLNFNYSYKPVSVIAIDTIFPANQGDFGKGKNPVHLTVEFNNGCFVSLNDTFEVTVIQVPILNPTTVLFKYNATDNQILSVEPNPNCYISWMSTPEITQGDSYLSADKRSLQVHKDTIQSYSFQVYEVDSLNGCVSNQVQLTLTIMDPSLPSISGNVLANSSSFSNGSVELFKQTGSNYQIITTQVLSADGSFSFRWLDASSYLLRAIPAIDQTDFLPSYYVSSTTWQDAYSISLLGKIEKIHLSLVGAPNLPTGSGSITGSVDVLDSSLAGPLKSFEAMPMTVFVMQNGQIVSYTLTNANGQYTIANLPDGIYDVYVETPGYNKFIQSVTINNGSTASADFTLKNGVATTTAAKMIANTDLVIYPNPTSDYLTIKIDRSIVSVEIMNIAGVSVLKRNGSTSINVSQLPVGMYIAKIITNKDTIIKTFIKQ